jgi:hypothetical protein
MPIRWTGPRVAWALFVAWLVFAAVAVSRLTPGMYSDPGWGVLAAEQVRIGRSDGLRTLVTADSANLRNDVAGRISWWPPSYQGVPAAWRWLGLPWGAALTASVLLACLAALVGWGAWFARFVSRAQLPWLLSCFAACRYMHAPFHVYDGEILALGVFPWVLWWNARTLSAPRPPSYAVAALGAGTAATFSVKYSLLLPSLALCAVWPGFAARRRIPWSCASAYVVGFAASLVVQHIVGIPGGPTPGSTRVGLAPERLLGPVAWLSLAGTDLDSLLEFTLGHPSRRVLTHGLKTAIGLALLLPLVAVAWRNARDEPSRGHGEVAAEVACVRALLFVVPSVLGLSLAWGAPIDDAARHVRVPALAALPWVWVLLVRGLWASRGRAFGSGALLAVFFLLPAAYGAATLTDKAFRRAPTETRLAPTHGVRLDLLGAGADAERFYAELRRAFPERETVFYWTSPDLALALADRRLIVDHADFVRAPDLARRSYRKCPRPGVVAVLPAHFADEEKGSIVRRSFSEVRGWRQVPNVWAPAQRVWFGACTEADAP